MFLRMCFCVDMLESQNMLCLELARGFKYSPNGGIVKNNSKLDQTVPSFVIEASSIINRQREKHKQHREPF